MQIRRTAFEKEGMDWQVQLVEKQGVNFLQFPILINLPYLTHGFSTRLGGVSEGMYESMNLSFSRGDQPKAVMENYRRICRAVGLRPEQLVFSDQTHTTNIRIVTHKDCGKGILFPRDYTDIDALMTDEPGVALVTFFADCVPIYLVDPLHPAIALVHSGWRGTVGQISLKTVQAMQQKYGSDPQYMIAVIGPSICRSCYEVSQDVIEQFDDSFGKEVSQTFYQKNDRQHYQLDLWKANYEILIRAGLTPEHIEVTDLCTCCNAPLLFSHRASHGKRGNLAAFLCLNDFQRLLE